MIGAKRTLVSVLVSLLLVAAAVGSLWLMASAGVFTGEESPLPNAPGGQGSTTEAQNSGTSEPGTLGQPRDPFEPIITSPPTSAETTSTTGDGSTTSSTSPDGSTTTTTSGTTTTTSGDTTTTTSGDTTTTTQDDTPGAHRITLLEVREEGGVRVAVIEVDGVTYTVGVGDTFAEDFKVIDLTENGGVFTYRDNAFTLSVGQSILK